MAAFDFSLAENFPQNVTEVPVALYTSATVPNPGELCLLDASHAGYVVTGSSFTTDKVDSDDNVVGLFSQVIVNPTASVYGVAFAWVPTNGTRLWLNGKALAKGSLAIAQEFTKVAIDVTAGGVETVDQSTTSKGIALIVPIQETPLTGVPAAGDLTTGAMVVGVTCAAL